MKWNALAPGRAAEVRAAVQMAVGATLALFIATALKLPHAYWSVISAVVVIQTSVGIGVFGVARDRALGTMIGAAAGLIVALARPDGVISLGLSVGLTTAGLAFLGAGRPYLKIAPVTAAIVIAGGTAPDGTASFALDRVMEILVGSTVGVGAILLLFPRHARAVFRQQAGDAAGAAAALLEMILEGAHADSPELARRHADLKRRLDALGQAAVSVIDLPAQRDTPARAALVRTFWRVRSDIVIIGRAFPDQTVAGRLTVMANLARQAAATLSAISEGRDDGLAGETAAHDSHDLAFSFTDIESAAAALGLSHLKRDLTDLSDRFRDLGLIERWT
jgi:uncharacterized membrane protein YccC